MISDERSKYKSWSNLKKKMHDLLCDSLKDKISYFIPVIMGCIMPTAEQPSITVKKKS